MTTPTPRPARLGGAHRRGEAHPPHVGPQEAHRLAPRPRPRRALARSQHRGRRPEPRGACAAPPIAGRRASPWNEPFAHAIVPNDVWCIASKAGSAPATGRASIPSPCRTRPLATSSPATGWSAPRGRPGDAARVSARLPSTASPRSSGPTTARPSPASAWAASQALSAWWIKLGILPERIAPGPPLEQNGRVSSAFTAPSRRRRRRRPGPTGGGSGEPSTTSGTATTTRVLADSPRGPGTATGSVRLYTPSFRPYPSRLNSPEGSTGPRSPCAGAPQRRDQVEGGQSLCERVLRGEPIGLLQQDERTWSIQFGPLLIGVLDDHARRIDKTPGTRVTYVPGLTVTHVPGRTEGGGRRGPRDLAGQARPPSYAKVSTGRGLAAIPPTFDGRARRGVLLPLPLGEGWGAGGGRRGPRDLAQARPPSYAKVSTGRGLAFESPLRSTEGHGAGSYSLSRWERVGVRAGGGGGRATLLSPPANAHRPLPPSPLCEPLQRELYTYVYPRGPLVLRGWPQVRPAGPSKSPVEAP